MDEIVSNPTFLTSCFTQKYVPSLYRSKTVCKHSLATDVVIDIGLKKDKAFWYANMGICLTYFMGW